MYRSDVLEAVTKYFAVKIVLELHGSCITSCFAVGLLASSMLNLPAGNLPQAGQTLQQARQQASSRAGACNPDIA